MSDNNNTPQSTQSIADYLAQLLKDRKQLAAFPQTCFNHVERLLDDGMFIFIAFFYFLFFILCGVRKYSLPTAGKETRPS